MDTKKREGGDRETISTSLSTASENALMLATVTAVAVLVSGVNLSLLVSNVYALCRLPLKDIWHIFGSCTHVSCHHILDIRLG